MLSLLVILVAMIAVINIVSISQLIKDADNLLTTLTTNEGVFPGMRNGSNPPPDENRPQDYSEEHKIGRGPQNEGFDPFLFDRLNNMRSLEMPYQSRYFWVKFDSDSNVTSTDTQHVAAITQETAINYASELYSSSREKGLYHSYRYMKGTLSDGGSIIIFLDISSSMINAYKLLFQSLLIGAFTLVAMFILVFLFSGKAVAPVVESLDKQKRFITDAGHELKTPLAVISAMWMSWSLNPARANGPPASRTR